MTPAPRRALEDDETEPATDRAVSTAKFWVAVVIFVTALAAYVILAIWAPDADYRGVFIFASTFAAAIGLSAQLDRVSQRVHEVEKNTNGRMHATIDAAVKKAVKQHFPKEKRDTPAA